MLVLGVGGGAIGAWRLLPADFDPKIFPIAAVQEARAAGLEGRMFHEFVWGGYLLLRWPEQRVFIDGGTDFYGENLYRQAIEIITLRPGWRDSLDTHGVQLVLLPVEAPMAHELVRDAAWDTWYCDPTAVMLVRKRTSLPAPPGNRTYDLVECSRAQKDAEETR